MVTAPPLISKRLLSLDFLRGAVMVFLILESSGLYEFLDEHTQGTTSNYFFRELTHHPWNGLRFWDLIQPAFMFIAGTAMAYSLDKQMRSGMTWTESFRKILKRCGWLFFWGVLDYAVRKTGLSFELWDVLTQLSFTTLVAFLIFRWKISSQIAVCVGLLLLTEMLYRFTNVPNFDQPFTDQHNFGNYMDWILMRKINDGGWVAINCIPTAVHTIAGALVGKVLLKNDKPVANMVYWGVGCLLTGFAMDWLDVTPIIKRISTSSFVLASLGWCLLFLAASYWWIDVKDHKKRLSFFTIVGMNSIFIYIFFEIVGHRWFNGYVRAISDGVLGWVSTPEIAKYIIGSFCIFTLEWLLCYFLYKKKIFFKL